MTATHTVELDGAAILVRSHGEAERPVFGSGDEAAGRAAFLIEALSWVGTPFRDRAGVKGPNGGVDCAMMLRGAAIDAGLIAPFEPPAYSPTHMLHRSDEFFIDWLTERLGMREVAAARPGDVAMFLFGKCYCHGGVVLNSRELVHAYKPYGVCAVTERDLSALRFISNGRVTVPMPTRYFSLWGA